LFEFLFANFHVRFAKNGFAIFARQNAPAMAKRTHHRRPQSPDDLGSIVAQYDKIIKENLIKAAPGLIRGVLGIKAVSIQPVTIEMQHTRERKADFVALVTDEAGDKFLVHIEFQVRNDPKMLYRMFDYAALETRKYPGVELRQYVIYLGPTALRHRPSCASATFSFATMPFGCAMCRQSSS
jgi:hypothetical protein